MTFPTVEFVDVRGDRWELSECDADGGCVCIGQFINNSRGDHCVIHELHIPLASLNKLGMAITAIQAAMAAKVKR